MGPPAYSECHVCHKEFGSRSLEFHTPKCLEKWRRNISESERSSTPTLLESDLSGSWNGTVGSKIPPKRPFMERLKSVRPSTATLDKPKVLDMRLQHKIDMSQLSRQMMEQLILRREQRGSSDYSSDFSSTSSSSLSDKTGADDDYASLDSESETRKRPSTIRLERPSSNIAVPVIGHTKSLPRRGKTATIRSNLPLDKRLEIAAEILDAKDKLKVPEPCFACGKEENPERFHSHPKFATKFKAKDKRETSLKTVSKLAVTRPNPIKYKSKSPGTSVPVEPHHHKSKASPGTSVPAEPSHHKSKASPGTSVPAEPSHHKSKAKTSQLASEERKTKWKHKTQTSSLPPGNEAAEGRRIKMRNVVTLASLPATRKLKAKKKRQQDKEREDSGAKKPQRVGTAPTKMCFICGREFGSRSLRFHEPQCLEKWRRENDQLPEHLRRAEPRRPAKELTDEEWREFAWKISQDQLVPCENCGRTFYPDRLEVHQRTCKPPPGSKKKAVERLSSPSYENVGRGSARPTVICYICGREFGSRSISIHEPQCLMKWRNQNDKLPEEQRRPEPIKPEAILDDDGSVDKSAMESAAWHSHLETLLKCEGCGRTFFPDRLTIHQRSCKQYKERIL